MDDGFDSDEVREDMKQGNGAGGGRQAGGGPDPSDSDARGGSSGTGGYGRDQDKEQALQPDRPAADRDQSRGERFDELSGGGRSADSVSSDPGDEPGEAEA